MRPRPASRRRRAGGPGGPRKRGFGAIPDRVGASPRRPPGRDADAQIGGAEILIDAAQQRAEPRHLALDVVLSAEDMRVVLDEGVGGISPCSAPDASLRWQAPNSLKRNGRSRNEQTR
jgi:hypothetical protein